MPAFTSRAFRFALVAAACAAVSACGSFDSATYRLASAITPYKIEVVQGNFVSKEQVEALKPGMGRQQVRDVLGTPLITDAFHANRWDYVFTLKRQGVPPQERKLAVFFKNDVFDHTEGDTMPTEAEFVATLDNRRKNAKVPELEASEEKLKQFVPEKAAPAPAPEAPAVPRQYPPLEAPAR